MGTQSIFSNKSRPSNKHHSLIRATPFHNQSRTSVALKSDHYLSITKLKWNKNVNKEQLK